LGTYSYKIELPKHHTEAGSIVLKNAKVVLNPVLKPKYGTVKISTSPESGMEIYLDNENTGKKSPAELKEISSGEHTIKIISEWYAPQSKKIVVEDGKITPVDFKLEPEFATINIKSNPQATIFINGVRKASGSFNGRLLSGVYTLKIEADKHYPHEQQLLVEPGKNQNLTHELKAIIGNLAITSTPFGATILLNGKNYGKTPETIKNLLVGGYTLELQLKGYKTVKKIITIQENKTLELNENLVAGSDEPKTQQKPQVKKTDKERRKNIFFATLIPHISNESTYSYNNFNYGMKYVNVNKNGFYIDYSQTFNMKQSNYIYNSFDKQIIEKNTGEVKSGTIIPESNIKSFDLNVGYVFKLYDDQYASVGLGYYSYELRQKITVIDFNGTHANQLILMPEYSISDLAPTIGYLIGLNNIHIGYSLSWTRQGSFTSKISLGYSFKK
jgi:hypothetical protein